jgi:cell division protein FtsB
MKNSIPHINKKIVVQYILIGVLLYFIFHLIYGNRGVLAYFNMQTKISSVTQELEDVRTERIEVEKKVNALKSESLDRDALDEEARRSLGLADRKEKVFVPEEDAKIEVVE